MLATSITNVAILTLYFLLTTSRLKAYSVVAFANENDSKKSPKKGRQVNRAKGFDKKIESYDDILRKFPTRIPNNENNAQLLEINKLDQLCPCGIDGKSYENCCYPYHMKQKYPETPQRVLQSRYTAFVYRIIGYIIDTTHTSCRDFRDDKIAWAKELHKNGMFDSIDFVSLNITQYSNYTETQLIEQNITEDCIEFQVTLRPRTNVKRSFANTVDDQQQLLPITCIQERSTFIKDSTTNSWLYASGIVRSTNNGLDDLILNQ